MAHLPIPGRGVPMPRPRPSGGLSTREGGQSEEFIGEMGPPPDNFTGEADLSNIGDAPLEDFIDPQSNIARILQQMQSAAENSRPQPLDTIKNANRSVPSNALTPEELIQMLLAQQQR